MSTAWKPRQARKAAATTWAVAAVVGIVSCSSGDRALSYEDLRKPAGSTQAVEARQKAEKRMVDNVAAYGKKMSLAPALITVNDSCGSGAGGPWPSGDNTYKMRCSLDVTGYFGAAPDRIGDVLGSILSAGDRYKAAHPTGEGGVVSSQNDFASKLVAYYTRKGPNPLGPNSQEPTQLLDGAETLEWDTVRSPQQPVLIQEPSPCVQPDPPIRRCTHQPESRTIAAIRRQYGMVFTLRQRSTTYFEILKNDKINLNQG